MAESSYPVAGGASVTDFVYEKLIGPITATGVVAPTGAIHQSLVYADSTGRQIKIQANRAAIIRGFRWESGTDVVIKPIAANTSGQTRLDLVVLRLNRSNYTIRVEVRAGTPAVTPAAPAAVQNEDANGLWELPLATVRVTSSNTAGQPSIAISDVTSLEYYIGPQPVLCHSTRRPPVAPGLQIHEYDTGRVFVAVGSAWHLMGEAGSKTQISPAAGWGNNFIYAQRRNGWTYFQALVFWNSGARAAGADTTICTLSAAHRPPYDEIYLDGHHGAYDARFRVDGNTGVVSFIESSVGLSSGQFVSIHPATWPSA